MSWTTAAALGEKRKACFCARQQRAHLIFEGHGLRKDRERRADGGQHVRVEVLLQQIKDVVGILNHRKELGRRLGARLLPQNMPR
jgi:hypothetical protein